MMENSRLVTETVKKVPTGKLQLSRKSPLRERVKVKKHTIEDEIVRIPVAIKISEHVKGAGKIPDIDPMKRKSIKEVSKSPVKATVAALAKPVCQLRALTHRPSSLRLALTHRPSS